MAVGGSIFIGLLLPRVGWQGGFFGLAAIAGLATVAMLRVQEPKRAPTSTEPVERPTFKEIARRAWQLVAKPGGVWLVLFVATYKMGEALPGAYW